MKSLYLGQGHTGHIRHGEITNRFCYPLFFLKFPSYAEGELTKTLQRIFLGFISFHASDYLWKKPGSLNENIHRFLKENCDYEAEEIWLVTMPRMFGYAFNPVSFWLCHRQGKLEAALCEVNNTFSERHFYWVAPQPGQTLQGWRRAEKRFHVSPFLPVEGFYQFQFIETKDRLRVDVNYFASEGHLVLSTWLEGRLSFLNQASFMQILFTYGWMTVLVIARIHYQALKLWFKGASFFRKPQLPKEEITR